MKICCLHHRGFRNFPRAQKQINSLTHLDGVNVKAIAPRYEGTTEQITIRGAIVYQFKPLVLFPNRHLFKILNILLATSTLFRHAYRSDTDIYHCYGVYALCVGVVLSFFSGSSVTYDAPEDYGLQVQRGFSGTFGKILGYIPWILEALIIRYAEVVFTVNSSDGIPADRLRRYNPETYVLENVPELSEFERDDVEGPLAEYSDRKILIYVGGVNYEKGGDLMIDCMTYVTDVHPEALLLVIGPIDDSYRESLQSKIDRFEINDNVELVGPIEYDDVPAYLANADIALQLYRPGPWNTRSMASSTIFRHMGHGLPLVVTDLPGMGTQIEEYGCGLTAPLTDVEAICRQINRLIENDKLAIKLGDRGQELIETQYNWAVESEKFLSHMPLSTVQGSDQ